MTKIFNLTLLTLFVILIISFLPFSYQSVPVFRQINLQNISLNQKTDHSKNLIILVFGGDVMLGRSVNSRNVRENDFLRPFKYLSQTFKEADIAFVNLESPFFENCPLLNTGMIFCADEKNVLGLTSAGIDIVNLANNHIENQGQKGLERTVQILEKNQILHIGLNDPVYKKVKGVTFAFLGYDDSPEKKRFINLAQKEKIKAQIEEAKKKANIVIVSFHWGVEYQNQPNTRQKDLAHFTIDSGANLSIGHHPHWIQPIENYRGKYIFYSLGNLIFDQIWSQKTKEGLVVKLIFDKNHLTEKELIPVFIEDLGQPRILEGGQKERILKNLQEETLMLKP